MDSTSHPYYPPSVPIPGYVPNGTSLTDLLPVFAGFIGAVIVSANYLAARTQPRLRPVDQFAVVWFAICGFLHVAFEGYYIYNRESIAGLDTTFAQLWKEYALSDSRYLVSEVFTVSVETITVFVWGPLSLLTMIAILRRSPTRHVSQAIICTAHLYGVALYYLTNWTESSFTGVSYSRPEFLYFWVYYVGFNAPWAVVPFFLLYDSFTQVGKAVTALDETESRHKDK